MYHYNPEGPIKTDKKVHFQNSEFLHVIAEELEESLNEETDNTDNDSRPPSPEPEETISINVSSLNAKLAHILIDLSLTNKRDTISVKALHDSGCSHSIISKQTFLSIPGANENQIKPAENIQISGFNGSISPIIGTVVIKLRFKGDNGVTKSYPKK